MTRWTRALLLALAGLSAALFVFAISRRFAFPYELTIVEAAQPLTTKRLLDGLPLYAQPTWEYVGPFYPPLSFLIDAALARLFGMSLPVLRVLSILSTFGTVAIVYVVLRRAQASRSIAAVCAAMLLAAHTRLGEILDIARVDAPEMLFAVLGLAAVERGTRPGAAEWRWTTIGAFALAAAILTKQTALTVPVGACLALLTTGQTRSAVRLGVLVGGLVAACGIALHVASDGWSTFYFIEMPGGQPMYGRDLVMSVGRLGFFFPAALAVCCVVMTRFWRHAGPSWKLSVWEAALMLSVVGAIFSNAKVGGGDNVWAVVVPLASVAIGQYWTTFVPALSPRHLLFYPIVWQVAVLPHRPIVNTPAAADVQAYEELMAKLEAMPRPLFNPMYPYESALLGLEPAATFGQINDFTPDSPLRVALTEAIEARRFASVVATTWRDPVFAGLDKAYPEPATWSIRGTWAWGKVRVFTRE
ncbi:MAG: glycosyltransferase family 39 protein [Vicinamibacterales bacterium]